MLTSGNLLRSVYGHHVREDLVKLFVWLSALSFLALTSPGRIGAHPYGDTTFVGGHPDRVQDPRAQFFINLKGLCGARFEGASTFPADSTDSFAGKLLVAEISSCAKDEVRVPFSVGEDRSRTWIFTRLGSDLQLKHDHRHADGTPDSVTMYGGMAGRSGTPMAQSFAADAHTASLIPAAATNVWTVSLSADGQRLTYHLERNGQPRFTAVLTRLRRS